MNKIKSLPGHMYVVRIRDTFNPPSPSCRIKDHLDRVVPCFHESFQGPYNKDSTAKGVATKESKSYSPFDSSIIREVEILTTNTHWHLTSRIR